MSSQSSSNTGTNWSMGAGLGAAVAASACCTVPLALVSLGIGGAWIGTLTALAPYRWVFVTVAFAALAYAGYNEWQLSRHRDCDCETAFSSTTRRSLLSVGALTVMLLVVTPWLVTPSPSAATQQALAAASEQNQRAADEASTTAVSNREIVLKVEGMTCKACPITVRKALEDVDGVYQVEVTYEPPEAVVRFDPSTVSVEQLTKATENAGFPSESKSST